jgi:hypothetical protein
MVERKGSARLGLPFLLFLYRDETIEISFISVELGCLL